MLNRLFHLHAKFQLNQINPFWIAISNVYRSRNVFLHTLSACSVDVYNGLATGRDRQTQQADRRERGSVGARVSEQPVVRGQGLLSCRTGSRPLAPLLYQQWWLSEALLRCTDVYQNWHRIYAQGQYLTIIVSFKLSQLPLERPGSSPCLAIRVHLNKSFKCSSKSYKRTFQTYNYHFKKEKFCFIVCHAKYF